MRFVWAMAVRELRASFRRLLFFFLCISIGVAAIVALRSAIASMQRVFSGEARTLLAGDVVLSSSQPLRAEHAERIARRERAAGAHGVRCVDLATMVRTDRDDGPSRMAELRAVEPGFPLYGAIQLQGGMRFDPALLQGFSVLVRPELLSQLGLSLGDGLRIGSQRFVIRGVVTAEPGRRIGMFGLGPRIFVALKDLAATGLLTTGSRATYQEFLSVPQERVPALVQALRADLRNSFVRVRSVDTSEGEIGENFGRAENYLSLVGLVILLLGGIGVSSVVRVFMQQRVRSMAVLKCVGARSSQLLAVYLLQVLVLGALGSMLGAALGAAAVKAIPADVIARVTPGLPDVTFSVTRSALLQGLGTGFLVSLLFSLEPLIVVRRVKPAILLRDTDLPRKRDPLRSLLLTLTVVLLVGVAIWQAGSLRIGLSVVIGFALTTLILHAAGRALIRALAPLAAVRWFALRHAVLKLTRPGNQVQIVMLAVGLGSFLTVSVRSLEELLIRDLSVDLSPDAPDLFLLDIQEDQLETLRSLLQASRRVDAPAARLVPILRARVTAVVGRDVNLRDYEDIRDRGSLGREYSITYRATLERNERIVAGRFWDAAPSTSGEVSIEAGLQQRYGIDVGDTLHFDVLGRDVSARVTSIRDVKWTDARAGGFMFVFRPGLLERAPHTYLGFLRGPDSQKGRTELQAALLSRLPNVSVIDGRDMLATVHRVLGSVTLAVSLVGALVVLSGLLILIGAVAMTKYRRTYEIAIFKTLGASRRMMFDVLLLEYGVLGALAGCVGVAAAMGLTFVVARFAFHVAWHPVPWVSALGVAGCTVLVAVVGVAASANALRHKPLATLRAE